MLALAAANFVGVLLFGALYAVAGAGLVSQTSFLVCLALLFLLVTIAWVRTERRHRHLPLVRRLGRAVAGLVIVLVATPIVVLMPAFWLGTELPVEAGLKRLLGPIMVLVLVALMLILLVNVVGGASATVASIRSSRRAS